MSRHKKHHRNYACGSLGSVLALITLASCTVGPIQSPPDKIPEKGIYRSYAESVQPILDKRCVVCHSCYEAPCQVDQTAFAGIDRGASDRDVYANRLFSEQPTRLFIDETSTEGWRRRGFFPIIHHHPEGDPRNINDSIFYQLIAYRKFNPLPKVRYSASSSRKCPDLNSRVSKLTNELTSALNVTAFADLGMPYGFPALNDEEFSIIRTWLLKGAPGPESEANTRMNRVEDDFLHNQVRIWEEFINGSLPRQQLISRYLYEHLIYAHIYFQSPKGVRQFFRFVRSRTASPHAVDEIATRLPYEDPGVRPFYYRLRPIEATIVDKNHITFELGPQQLDRIRALFLEADWSISEKDLPGYLPKVVANPFIIFEKIPARARYQFMLDNAEYFVTTFMKGPVCRGQIALNVIDDHFFIFFLDPDADQFIANSRFGTASAKRLLAPFPREGVFSLSKVGADWSLLELPFQVLGQLRKEFYPYYKNQQLKYLRIRDEFYQQGRPDGFSLDDIWDGDGHNSNASLTVFRHFDSASVRRGVFGGNARTALMLDYPIFERMYYNLVANFDIFSDIKLQLSTRLYMDDLRIEAEQLFLSFLPLAERQAIQRSWYQGAVSQIEGRDYPFYGTLKGKKRDSQIKFAPGVEVQHDFVRQIVYERFSPKARGAVDRINIGRKPQTEQIGKISSAADLDRELKKIGSRTGSFVLPMPDLSFVRFRRDQNLRGQSDLVYTFVRNREHLNIKYLFGEGSRLAEKNDSLSILKNFHASYPSFFFDVSFGEAQQFLQDILTLRREDDSFSRFIARYGVRRTDEKFWEVSDWFNARYQSLERFRAGWFDLSRYENY